MNKSPYSQKEEEILKFWKQNDVFSRSVSERPEGKPYVFYDGPPFATGLPHYGHILSSVTKDLFPRYYTMKGCRVRRRWGWDCHGLPIETLVEKKLQISGKKQIETLGIDKFNDAARDMVLEYTDQWEKMVDRIGRWVEFKDSYKTMDSTYMESVWWTLKQLWDKELIYEGRKVLMYCPRCETPVSNAEISMDNSYKDVEEESVYVKFKLKAGQKFKNYETKDATYMLAWTTTPWTLPANVALAVGADIDYTALRIKGAEGLYILASALVEKVFQDKEIEIVHDDLKGSDLEGLYYEPLFAIPAITDFPNKAWYVATADFVTTEDGTGVVHTAVIYGEDDYALGLNLDLPQVPLLDSTAKYNKEAPNFLQGKFIKDAEPEIIADLEKRGLLFKVEKFVHSYPFCWRCESPLIYNAISAWFINNQKVKDRIVELNEKVNWYPEYLKHGRFLNILKSAPDWNISRNRYWATPLPFFKCEDEKCDQKLCVGSLLELKELASNYDEVFDSEEIREVDLHKQFLDKIIIKCPSCGKQMKRIEEVIDCWVESAAMPYAEWHYPFENKAEFESRFPGQFIGEYIAQTRAWFYYMHTLSALLFDDISFENVVATGTILSDKGEKLSKSKQNYPDPWIILDQYGADTLRFYLMNSVVMQADNLFFNEVDIKEIYNKVINTSYNVLSFYNIYKKDGLEGLDPKNIDNVLDRWIISKSANLIKACTEDLDAYNTVRATRAIRQFIEDLSTWWVRRSRERLRDGGQESDEALKTLRFVLIRLAKILAPVTPFIAEAIWQDVKSDRDEDSVHLSLWPEFDEAEINLGLEQEMADARKIVELSHSLRAQSSIKVRQPLRKIYFSKSFKDKNIVKTILDEVNIEAFSAKEDLAEPIAQADHGLEVAIDIHLDDRLKELGAIRDFTRAIQDKRKKSGLDQNQQMNLLIDANQETLDFIDKHQDQIIEACSLSKISRSPKTEDFAKVELSNGEIFFILCETS